MRVALVADGDGGALLQAVADDGGVAGPPERVGDVAAAVGLRERAERPRWVWAAASEWQPRLLRAGVRLARCHDLLLTEGLLLGHEGRFGEPQSLGAAWARLRGRPLPQAAPAGARPVWRGQPALFDPDRAGLPDGDGLLDVVVAVHAEQQRRLAAVAHPDRFALLVAAEPAGALAAAEMTDAGLPWRADVHDRVLTDLLGPRPPAGVAPRRLRELREEIRAAFGGRQVNPDSPAQVLRAFAADGLTVPSTRSQVLRGLAHPAVAPLLAYKELARLHAAYGWGWLDAWVRAGRFHPEYVPGGVVSGRWATSGGGALQIPRAMRRAVVADPGWTFVVADAGQLEPRVLAAVSGDRGLALAAAGGDLYAALAAEAFAGDRRRAKVALLGVLYGQSGSDAGQLLAVLRRRFPEAVAQVEAAARAGEQGRLVRSWLGRTCPPPSTRWRELAGGRGEQDPDGDGGSAPGRDGGSAPGRDGEPAGGAGGEAAARRAVRDRGRFTRNFVVQASAADWALVLLADLRRRLAELPGPELVFFQHDEVLVHCPQGLAGAVAAAVTEAGEEARPLVFGDTAVRFPLKVSVVGCYADAT